MIVTCIISSAGYPKNLPVLSKCIRSLIVAKTNKTKLRIIVTTNNHKHLIEKNRHIDHICVSPKSSGFVGINNAAVINTMRKKSDYYLIINDDAWVDRNFFHNLNKTVQIHPEHKDIVIPFIFDGSSTAVDSFGVEYFRTGYPKNASMETVQTSLASMSCLLLKTEFLKKMISSYGYFLNPLLTWYLDDVEFSVRALALGGNLYRDKTIVAHHLRTYTWGRKSYAVIYYSFRNLIWVILLTWPKRVIINNLPRIICWQILTCVYCLLKYSPLLYPKIIWDTCVHWRMLMKERKNILSKYKKINAFNAMFSSLEIRHDRVTF